MIIDPFEQAGRRWKLRPPVGKQRQPAELREILPDAGVLCVRDIWQIAKRFTALCLTLHNFALRLRGQPELFPVVPNTTGPAPSLAELTREVQRLANSEPGAEE